MIAFNYHKATAFAEFLSPIIKRVNIIIIRWKTCHPKTV